MRTVGACELAFDESVRPPERRQTDGFYVAPVARPQQAPEPLATGPPFGHGQLGRHRGVSKHSPINVLHQVERRPDDLDVIAVEERTRHRNDGRRIASSAVNSRRMSWAWAARSPGGGRPITIRTCTSSGPS